MQCSECSLQLLQLFAQLAERLEDTARHACWQASVGVMQPDCPFMFFPCRCALQNCTWQEGRERLGCIHHVNFCLMLVANADVALGLCSCLVTAHW